MPASSSTSGSVARDDYLEQISHLIEEKGYARPIDISKRLGISQASVTNMLQRATSKAWSTTSPEPRWKPFAPWPTTSKTTPKHSKPLSHPG